MACRPPETWSNPRDVGELAEPLRSRIHTMIIDAPADGLILISGYRTPYMQWTLRNQRCPGRECDRGCRGSPVTAIPYASNHQRRTAADMGGRALRWAHDNAWRYGLSAEVVPSEDWHFEVRGNPSVRIIPYGAPRPPDVPVDPNKGRNWLAFGAGATDPMIYANGGLNNQIAEMQLRLTSFALRNRFPEGHPGQVDGIYGTKSQWAILAFKVWIAGMQRYMGQPEWAINTNVGHDTIAMLRFWTA